MPAFSDEEHSKPVHSSHSFSTYFPEKLATAKGKR